MTGPVFDLRQYTLVPGGRDVLVGLFDRYFVAGQEAEGIRVIGQFHDLDDPDRFVWLRGFASMADRGPALARFYGGPVWREHSAAANATMVDSDDALLLEPLDPADPPRWSAGRVDAQIGITVVYLSSPVTPADRLLAGEVAAALTAAGVTVLALLASHVAENNFPALPLREENVLVWVTRRTDPAVLDAALAPLARRGVRHPTQHLRLRPTPGSRLH